MELYLWQNYDNSRLWRRNGSQEEETETFIPFSRKIFRQFKSQAARKLEKKTFPFCFLFCATFLSDSSRKQTRLGLLEILELVIVLIKSGGDFIDWLCRKPAPNELLGVRSSANRNELETASEGKNLARWFNAQMQGKSPSSFSFPNGFSERK